MQEEAAERRRQENENRGIKDPERVRRQQEKAAQMEKDEIEAAKLGGAPVLKVRSGCSWESVSLSRWKLISPFLLSVAIQLVYPVIIHYQLCISQPLRLLIEPINRRVSFMCRHCLQPPSKQSICCV